MQSTRAGDKTEVKEKLHVQIVIPDDESSSTNDETASSHADSSTSSSIEIETAPDAFKLIMNETVLFALSKDYTARMNILRAFGDAFCEGGEFSWARSGKLTGAIAIGALASIFVVNPSGAAANTLTDAFKQQTGIDISYGPIIARLFQVASTGGTVALATFSGLNLIETYLGHTSNAEKFLKYEAATCGETSKKIGKKVFDLLCAIASSVPSFFFTQSTSVPLAVCTAVANTAINWLGVSSLPLTRSRIHPARRIELNYLNEQLEAFLKLPSKRQNKIIKGIQSLQKKQMNDLDYKQLYARLLNLAKPDSTIAQDDDEIKIQEEASSSCPKKAFAIALGSYMTVTQLAFTEATYAGISRLFSDTSSAPAISSGAVAAAFSVLPNFGFGFFSGYHAANAITSSDMPFAKLYLSKTREALKYTIYIISLFAGGTAFTLAMSADADLTNLAGITDTLKSALDWFTGIVSYSTGVIITAYYALRLCDEILIFLAQRCADEETRRLFTFVLETRHMHKIISESSDENYLAILRWKLTSCKELSSLLHCLFKDRLSEAEYNKVQADTNESRILLKDWRTISDFETTDSFVHETPEWQEQHSGLRRRKCVMSCYDESESSASSSAPGAVASVQV